jgi:hypothetical protein
MIAIAIAEGRFEGVYEERQGANFLDRGCRILKTKEDLRAPLEHSFRQLLQ